MTRPISDMPWFKPCAHPGCTTELRKSSYTYDAGLCMKHGGRRVGRASVVVAQPYAPPERAGVRSVEVATVGPSSASSADYRRTRVSLAKEPWA